MHDRKDKLMNNMNIKAIRNEHSGQLDFYAENNRESYYIFSRKFRVTLYDYFKAGVSMNKLFDFSRTHRNPIVANTIDHMRSFLKYIEKENDIQLFRGKRYRSRPESVLFTELWEDIA